MSVTPQQMLERVLAGENLDEPTATALLRAMASGELAPALAGALLVALRGKGETAEEIRGFARGMRELAKRPAIAPGPYVDIVGTGGDGSGSLNLSTGSALPQRLETERVPCFTIGAPHAAASSALPVLKFRLPEPSPPVPTMST